MEINERNKWFMLFGTDWKLIIIKFSVLQHSIRFFGPVLGNE